MDNVTLRASVVNVPVPGGMRFEVTSQDRAIQASIRSMLTAHSGTGSGLDGIELKTEPLPRGVAMTAVAQDAAGEARIRGLGFFGLLASGGHHQRHHEMIAMGQHH
jgi:hypothetical protein